MTRTETEQSTCKTSFAAVGIARNRRPWKILHVIPSVAPHRGGPSQVLRFMAHGLAEKGHCVHVATTDDSLEGRLVAPLGTPLLEGKVTWWYFPRQLRPYTCSLPLTAWLWTHVREYDLVHIHAVFSYPSTIAALIARARGVPYVVRPLGVLNRWGRKTRRPRLKRLSFTLLEKTILENSAAVQYTSDQERIEAEELGFRAKSVIIPNPVEIPADEEAATELRQRTPVILFMSRIDQKKGIDLLIRALAQVQLKFPEIALIIAGGGDQALESNLRSLATEASVADSITWMGFVSGRAKQELLERSAIFVLPSYSENFGVAVVEAMAAGLPVIVSNQVGIHQMISEHQAGIVTPCEVQPLSEALCQLLANPEKRRQMGMRGRQLAVSEFSVPVVTQKLLGMYSSILSR